MSVERKDVRVKLDADIHAGVELLADVDGAQIGAWCEEVIAAAVRKRIHDAQRIASVAQRRGISGIHVATAGSGRES